MILTIRCSPAALNVHGAHYHKISQGEVTCHGEIRARVGSVSEVVSSSYKNPAAWVPTLTTCTRLRGGRGGKWAAPHSRKFMTTWV